MRYLKQILLLLLICTKGYGQQLTYTEFIDQVKKNHPISKQAKIVVDKAKETLNQNFCIFLGIMFEIVH